MAKTTKQMRRNVQATIFLIGWHWSYTESSFWRTDSTEIRSSGLYSQSFSVKSHTLHSKDWIEVPVLVFIHYFIRHCWSTEAVKDSHEVRATGRENAFDLSKYTFCLSSLLPAPPSSPPQEKNCLCLCLSETCVTNDLFNSISSCILLYFFNDSLCCKDLCDFYEVIQM